MSSETSGLRAAVEALAEQYENDAAREPYGGEPWTTTADVLRALLAASEADRTSVGRIVCTNCDADDLGCTACGAHGTLTVASEADRATTGEREFYVLAADGRSMYTSAEVAGAVAAGDDGYTIGPDRSPVIAAYTRPHAAAEWVLLGPATPPADNEEGK